MKKLFINIIVLTCFFFADFSIAATPIPKISKNSRKASIIADMHDGRILYSSNDKEVRYPASLVKMMTLYLVFKEIDEGRLSLDKKLLISKKAAAMPRTNLNLKPGGYIPVRKAILGLIVHSSNDTAVVLAEAIAGTEAKFVEMMNRQAKKLKMKNTTYRNASGWPNKAQKSTARDLAKLAIALKKDFPQFFSWFSVTSFTFNGKTYKSHNNVLKNYKGATGLKTGFINASGFNIATTAQKEGKHLVGIVMGGNTAKERDTLMTSLLDNAFSKSGIKDSSKNKIKKEKQKNKTKKQKNTSKTKVKNKVDKNNAQKKVKTTVNLKDKKKKNQIKTKVKEKKKKNQTKAKVKEKKSK
jgi:D-alanyl-D-alanine carboxypeptidase